MVVDSTVRFVNWVAEHLTRMFVGNVNTFVDVAVVVVLSLVLGTLVLSAAVLTVFLMGAVAETLWRTVQGDVLRQSVRETLVLAVVLGLTLAVSSVLLDVFMGVSPAVWTGAIVVGVGEGLLLCLIAAVRLIHRNGQKQENSHRNGSDSS